MAEIGHHLDKYVTLFLLLCVCVCEHQCVWSWPVHWSWLLKGQSVSVSPADSTLLSPVCGLYTSTFVSIDVCVYMCLCTESHVALCALVSEHVCTLVREAEKPESLCQLMSCRHVQRSVANSRLRLDLNWGQLGDPSPSLSVLPFTRTE